MKDHTAWVSEFSDELEDLSTNRSTTLEIIGQSGSERDWQDILAYFIDPNESHSIGTTVLEAFVDVVAAHPDTNISGLTDDLDTVTVETEVSTPPKGFADLLIWAQGEWFICIEMKVDASETDNQTERYAKTPRLGSLVKNRHEAQGGESQYVYLAPDGASPPQTDKFVEVPWRDVVSNIEAQLTADKEKSQSQAQLSDFLQTIKKHLTMDEYDTISDEAQLYAEYKSEMKNTRREYENELNRLKDTMEEALQNEFQAAEWQTFHRSGRSTRWTQLYKSAWHNDAFHVEYEPHFKLGKNPPEIRIAIDIEKGKKQVKTDVLDHLTDHLDKSVVEEEGWVITGDVKPCLTKSIPLDVDSPQTSIEEAVQSLRVFDRKAGQHIDDAVEAHIPSR